MKPPVVIVGAGLSGLHAADLLEAQGHRVIVLESRDRIGGRILSVGGSAEHRVDLGPTWFWPEANPRMTGLANRLQLDVFEQHAEGRMAIEDVDGVIRRNPFTWRQEPRSHRAEGGTALLVERMAANIAPGTIRLNASVSRIVRNGSDLVRVHHAQDGIEHVIDARAVITTLPPRLLAERIAFDPVLPARLIEALSAVPTWMAGHAKFAAIYDKPFWRDTGDSGTAFSARGPLSEIHDASSQDGRFAALFGFFGVPATYRLGIGRQALAQQALKQLSRLFGAEALDPVAWHLHDWADDRHAASIRDRSAPQRHPEYRRIERPPEWKDLWFPAGTETSPSHGGFMEGALESAEYAVGALMHSTRGATAARDQGAAR